MKFGAIIAILFIGLTAQDLFSAVDQEIAVVTRVQGMATVRYGASGTEALIGRGFLLMDRSIIHTGTKGMVRIRFINSRTTVLVQPESELLLTINKVGEGGVEMVRCTFGQALFDVHAMPGGSFDIATPATMVTARECAVLVTHEEYSGNSAIFLSTGTCRVADPGFSQWSEIRSPAAAYVNSGTPILYQSPLTAQDNARLDDFTTAIRSMKVVGPLTHTLVIRSDSGGTVLPGNVMTALQGYAVELVANPAPGYAFLCWDVLHGTVMLANAAAESTTVSVTSDALVAARFTNSPTRLVVRSKGEGTTIPEGVAIIPRKHLWKISALPFFGHVLKKLHTSKGIKLLSRDSVSATIIADVTEGQVTAEFAKRNFLCSVKGTPGGSVQPSKSLKMVCGDSVVIKAIADKGYVFTGWEIFRGSALVKNHFAMVTTVRCDSSDIEIRGHFNKTATTAMVTVNGHECAAVNPSGTIAVPVGESLAVTALLKPGYEVEHWSVRSGSADIRGGEHVTVFPSDNCEIVPVIVTKRYNCTITSSGPGATQPTGLTQVFHGTPFTIAALPEQGKQFVSWQVMGGDASISDRTAARTTVTLSSTDAVIAAEFATATGKVTVDATAGGYTSPAGPQIMYEGKVIGLKAVANPRAAFLGWVVEPDEKTLDFSDTITAHEQLVTMKKVRDVNITARFSTETVELSVLNNGLGMTEPAKSLWVPQDQWIPLNATPAEGNTFVQWVTVTGTQVAIRDKFNAETEINPGTENATIKALFASSGQQEVSFDTDSTGRSLLLTITTDVGHGTVEPTGPVILQAGMPVTLSATAAPDYYFIEWSVAEGNAVITDPYNRITNVSLVQRNARIEARFGFRKVQTIETEFVDPVGQRKSIVIQYR